MVWGQLKIVPRQLILGFRGCIAGKFGQFGDLSYYSLKGVDKQNVTPQRSHAMSTPLPEV